MGYIDDNKERIRYMGYIDDNKASYDEVYKQGWGNRYPDSNMISYYFNYMKPLLMDKQNKKMKMLDFGCSLGANTKFFEEQGFEVYGIDISEIAIENCVEINGFQKEHFKACNILDVQSLETVFNTKFDLIVASEVLYYFSKEDVQNVLSLFDGGLNENGIIYANWATFSNDIYREYKENYGKQFKVDVSGSISEALNVYLLKDKDEMLNVFDMFEMKYIKTTQKELLGENESLHYIGKKR